MASPASMPYNSNPATTEWTDPDAPPPFGSVKEAADALEKPLDQALIDQFNEEAAARIAQARDEDQSYFQRADNGKLVRTEREYHECGRKGVELRVINHALAVELLNAEDRARKLRKEKKDKRKAKRRK